MFDHGKRITDLEAGVAQLNAEKTIRVGVYSHDGVQVERFSMFGPVPATKDVPISEAITALAEALGYELRAIPHLDSHGKPTHKTIAVPVAEAVDDAE